MRHATAALRHDHDLILATVQVVETMALDLVRGRPALPGPLALVVDFLRLFADRSHHLKEEEHLFPLLQRKGLPKEGGPIAVLRHEHEQGRTLLFEMEDALRALPAGGAGARLEWAKAGLTYAHLERQHIVRETDGVLTVAEHLLGDEEQRSLAEEFERVRLEVFPERVYHEMLADLEGLRTRLFPAWPEAIARRRG